METETIVGGAHRADRPELSDYVPGTVRFNPNARCTQGHLQPCPMHQPTSYAAGMARHRSDLPADQAVAS